MNNATYDVNLRGDDIRTERNADVLLNAYKDIGLANKGKTKYMKIVRHRGVIANEHVTVGGNLNEKVKTLNIWALY